MPVRARVDAPSCIYPEVVYPLAGFIAAGGISYCRIRKAARDGIELPVLRVGRRVYVEGSAGIEFIRKLAAQTAAAKEQPK
jgi:hypothetical protein